MNLLSETMTFEDLQQDLAVKGCQTMIENIKILLYQTDDTIFDWIDFDNDEIYQEPLLFAYFNDKNKHKHSLKSILYGYALPENRTEVVEAETDEFGRIYLPKIGWIITSTANAQCQIVKQNQGNFDLYSQGQKIDFKIESIEYVESTKIELLKYAVPLFKQCYFDTEQNLLDVEIENITLKHKQNLTKAFSLISEHLPQHLKLIELVTKKCVIFNVETHLRNSFAIMSAQGTGFFNAYQNDYNEVFFVDDIVHQTGHVIFNAMIYDAERFIIPDPNSTLQTLRLRYNNEIETRSISVVFHAMYTYYTTFIVLDACLDANVFEGEKRHEALGRVAFYVDKCYRDIVSIDKDLNDEDGAKEIFTEDGMLIYSEIKNTLKYIIKKWRNEIKEVNLENQPYNFTYSIFKQSNPM